MDSRVIFLKPQTGPAGKNIVRDLVYGCWCNGRRIGGMQMPPLNDLYAATHCRQPGVEVVFLDAQMEPERYQALARDGFRGVAAVVMLSSTQSFREDVGTIKRIKSLNPKVRAVLFGSHPTFMPAYCLAEECVDFLVQGEPEATLKELIRTIINRGDPGEVRGAGYRDGNGKIRVNPKRPFMKMDDLPIPDRSLLPARADYFNPVVKRLPYTTMQTSRGCPGRCIFCTAPTFYGNRYRFRSPENVLAELKEVKRLGFREVFFRDETFTANRERNLVICEAMIRENLDLSWIANGRVDLVDKESLELMKRAGCHMLKFGVESGSDAILKAYRKGTSTDQARAAFRRARDAGLETHAHFVMGGPGESRDSLERTVDFAKELKPTTVSFGILTPYPGTELFARVAQKHPEIRDGSDSNMDNLHVQGFYSESICGLKGEDLSRAVVRAYRRFYFRPAYLLERLRKIRTLEELVILGVAGLNVLQFSLTGEK
ncbi:MAG: radical SAM protein [Deltaproteobacteria bacterium]|nr:MAG: radical SAM protein [Deltaproteobacteria bacterium]